jgi:catechol 2,3-dioxygenase-like lactoylglutathione lyase family enzyme
MFEMDHVAVPSKDIPGDVKYYVDTFGATVLYADKTWAFLRVGQGKLALVTPAQHPPHVALRVDLPTLAAAAARAGKEIDKHRDGTQGIYVDDPSGNVVELIYYPPGNTHYEAGSGPGTGGKTSSM